MTKQTFDWKTQLTDMISAYIADYMAASGTPMRWRTPLVGFADAGAREFRELKQVVRRDHALPEDVLPDATIVVSYFLPFPAEIADSNRQSPAVLMVDGGRVPAASSQWAMAYRETNLLFAKLNDHLAAELKKRDQQGRLASLSGEPAVCAALPLPFASMDSSTLTSRWSQRHVARIAGLGTFGMNNMLITESGCGGRYSSIVTNLDAVPDPIRHRESCLYKRTLPARERNGGEGAPPPACGLCIARCPSGALTGKGFDRFLCNKVCDANQEYHDPGKQLGTDSCVCGKCVVGLPCTFRLP